jgi:putative transposase
MYCQKNSKSRKRALVKYLEKSYQVTQRRACEALLFTRSTYYYKSKRDGQAILRMRTRDIAAVRVRYGYKMIHVLLKREGRQINHKQVYRLYCEEGLNLRKTTRKRKPPGAALRIPRQQAEMPEI